MIRRLEAPIIDVAEFAALHLQLQVQQQQQGAGQGGAPGPSDGTASGSSGGSASSSASGSQALAEVLQELLQQRPMVRLDIGHAGELAFALKALALAGQGSQDGSSAASRPTYVAFLPDSSIPEKPGCGKRQGQGQGQSQGQAAGSRLGQSLARSQATAQQLEQLFPLALEVVCLPATPLRVSVMGAAQGRMSRGSKEDGLQRTLATKVRLTPAIGPGRAACSKHHVHGICLHECVCVMGRGLGWQSTCSVVVCVAIAACQTGGLRQLS